MRKLIIVSLLIVILGSCTKQEVTKIVPSNNSVTVQNTAQNQIDGTINGGGGKGVRCQKNNSVTIETLDLYEAKVLYGLDVNYKATNQEEAIDLIATLLTKHLWNPSTIPLDEYKKGFKEQFLNNFIKNIKFISPDKKLKLTNDSFEPLIAQNCEMVQIAVYYDESILLVDQALWEQLDWVNKIALVAHEAIYFLDRKNGSTNSISTRKLVGQLFSSKGARPKADGIPEDNQKFTTCYISDKDISVGYFYIYDSVKQTDLNEKKEGLELVFNFLKNSSFLFRTSALLENTNLEDIFQENFNNSAHSDLYIESYSPTKSIHLKFKGKGLASMILQDERTGEISSEMIVTCNAFSDKVL